MSGSIPLNYLKMNLSNYSCIILGFVIIIQMANPSFGETSTNPKCPASNGIMKRVGSTRYFIFHNPRGKSDKFYNFEEAKAKCSGLKGFKMATIEKQTTFAEVARALEKLVTKHSFFDTWYWLDAKYDNKKQGYFWAGDLSRPIKYSNFLYRYPRPTGLAGFVDEFKTYQINQTTQQCLTLALPFPAVYNMKSTKSSGGIIYGFSATFDEKPCIAKTKMHAICEYIGPECNESENDPFTLSEDKDSYFEEGNWVIGRRYFINWKQVTKKESEEYCKGLGMELFNPVLNEAALIPHIKLWSRGITVSQFWTNWKYNIQQPGNGMVGDFIDAFEVKIATIRAFVNVSAIGNLEAGRSDKYSKSLCVAMQLSAEYKKFQYPCPDNHKSACNWNFIQYVPANCNNFHGTICESKKEMSTKVRWQKKWTSNPVDLLNNVTHILTAFGFKENKNTLRSGFKQTFGSLLCPEGYRMPRVNDTRWYYPRYAKIEGYNEYQESFWVVDDEGFNKTINSKCSLSTPVGTGSSRTIKIVPCTEWHFYLCDRIIRPVTPIDYKLPYEIVKAVSWDDRKFERKYPILA